MWATLLIGLVVGLVVAPMTFVLGGILGQAKVRDYHFALLQLTDHLQRFLDRERLLSVNDTVVVTADELTKLRTALDRALDSVQGENVLQGDPSGHESKAWPHASCANR